MSFVDTSDIRAYIREPSAAALLIFVSCDTPLASSLAIPPCETVCSRWNHEITFPVRNFCSSRTCSPSHVERIVRDKSFRRWPSDLLTQCPAPGNSLDQTQSFPFEWYARTSKLWLPNHRRYAPSVWPDTGACVMREKFGVPPIHHIWSTDRTSALDILIGEYHAWVRTHVQLCGIFLKIKPIFLRTSFFFFNKMHIKIIIIKKKIKIWETRYLSFCHLTSLKIDVICETRLVKSKTLYCFFILGTLPDFK